MVLLVTYDLNKPGQDYSDLYKAIKDSSTNGWWHYLDSTWLIDTNLSTSQVAEQLKGKIDKNDSLLVIRVCKDYQGWLSEEAWQWLQERLF